MGHPIFREVPQELIPAIKQMPIIPAIRRNRLFFNMFLLYFTW